MKKLLFSLAVTLGLIGQCFATGSIPANGFQSGTVTFSTSTLLQITNTFQIPYTEQPVLLTFGSATNLVTINFVTTTNFSLSIPSSNPTNDAVAWTAYLGYPRIQTGTCSNSQTVVFPVPYAFPPTVVATSGSTATNAVVAITAVTTTNFLYSSVAVQTNSWISIGTAFQPGAATVTQ